MNQREYIAPEALAVLDSLTGSMDDYRAAADAWVNYTHPLLTPRAVAILEAVEAMVKRCEWCGQDWRIAHGLEVQTCDGCVFAPISHAWRTP